MNEIMVSVCCITYNQADYIEKAINSFLRQKTTFSYEILIHDDASTDGTDKKVKKYVELYPGKITAVFQKENQHSKGVRIISTFLYPIVKGKYIALCEGDDFWTDEYKLQKQFEYMESHSDCSLCLHSSVEVKADNEVVLAKNILTKKIALFDIKDALSGIGRKVATNSFFCRTEYAKEMPEWKKIAPCGDYVLPIICAKHGNIAYLPQIMSAHRAFAKNSMTVDWNKNVSSRRNYYERYDLMLKSIDENTNYKYSEILKQESIRNWFNYYLQIRDKKNLKQKNYVNYFKSLSFKEKLRISVELNAPWLLMCFRKIKYFILDTKRKMIKNDQ